MRLLGATKEEQDRKTTNKTNDDGIKFLRFETDIETLSYHDAPCRTQNDDHVESSGGARVIGRFSGAASLLCKINTYGYLFAPTAFDNCIEYMKTHGVVAGLNHDWDNPAGLISNAYIVMDKNPRLMIDAQIIDTPSGNLVQKLISTPEGASRGAIRSLSIGHKVLKYKRYEEADEVIQLWSSWGYTPTQEDLDSLSLLTTTYKLGKGIEIIPGVEVIEESRVFEVSPVLAPGQHGAGIDQVLNLIRDGQLVPKEQAVKTGEPEKAELSEVMPEKSVQSEPTPEQIERNKQIEEILREAKKRV